MRSFSRSVEVNMSVSRLRSVRFPTRLDPPIAFESHSLELSARLRVVVIDRRFCIKLTPIEYHFFSLFLSRPHTLVPVHDLTEAMLQRKSSQNVPQSIDRHINALRNKLRYSGLTILRVV